MLNSPETTTDAAQEDVTDPQPSQSVTRSGWMTELILTWGIILVWSFVRVPIPGVNEPHYLCKAKSLWDPAWCSGDFFLTSSNPHYVYYLLTGWLTQYLTFEQLAIASRIIGLLILAIGWGQLSRILLRSPASRLFAGGLFLFSQAMGTFSGEWVIGGGEGKVFAYGFSFWAWSELTNNRRTPFAILQGLAIAFHPLVGLWMLICMLTGLMTLALPRLFSSRQDRQQIFREIPAWLTSIGLMVIVSVPGLVPALSLLAEPSEANTKFNANYLQVYYRLKHHLDPMEFPQQSYLHYLILSVLIIGLAIWGKFDKSWKLAFRVFLISLLIALTGVLIGLRFEPPLETSYLKWRVALLKYYPFRIYDILAPLMASLAIAGLVFKWFSSKKQALLSSVAGIALITGGLIVPYPDHNPSRMAADQYHSWVEACDWISQHTDDKALFLTPNQSWAFKWYSNRAEYVTFKDCPQDARGVVEWNNRLKTIRDWAEVNYDDQKYSKMDLTALSMGTGITHVIARRLGPFDLEPIYQNEHYRIYDLRQAMSF